MGLAATGSIGHPYHPRPQLNGEFAPPEYISFLYQDWKVWLDTVRIRSRCSGYPGASLHARRALSVKAQICNLIFVGSSLTADGVFFWYGPLASLSLQIDNMASDHYGNKMEVPANEQGSKSVHSC